MIRIAGFDSFLDWKIHQVTSDSAGGKFAVGSNVVL